MAKAKIGYLNLADDATISASSQLLLAPASNLQEPNVARKWRSYTTSDSILLDLGSVTVFDAVALMGITGNTIRFRYSITDPTGALGEVWDSGVLTVDTAYNQSIDLAGGPARYILINLTADTYCEAGRLVVSELHEFVTNFSYGWQRKWIDLSTPTKTRGGQTQINLQPKYRSIQVTFNDIAKAELYGDLENIDRINGLGSDVLFVTDPDSDNLARDTVWGLMQSLSGVGQTYFGRFSKQYDIDERL